MAEVEKIEATQAVEAVKEADKKLADIKAEKAAKKAERQNKRLGWKGPFKYVGKFINVVEDHPVATGVCVLAGVPLGVGGVYLYDKYGKKKPDDDTVDVDVEVEVETETEQAPFDTEA